MGTTKQTAAPSTSCTAFDHARRVVWGSYVQVAIAVKEHVRAKTDASVLIFDDNSGEQVDFDLRGTDQEIAERIRKLFPASSEPATRSVGRPRLGVVSREVTLMPHHWEWLAEQPGGASVTLRRLVEGALRAGPSEEARLRKVHERTYRFMSAMAGNLPNFEEAARALFANNIPGLKKLIVGWPADIRSHIVHLCKDAPSTGQSK
jgi:uncharacterized protein